MIAMDVFATLWFSDGFNYGLSVKSRIFLIRDAFLYRVKKNYLQAIDNKIMVDIVI